MPTILSKPLHRNYYDRLNPLLEDVSENSPNYFVISNMPNEFSLGKNSFNIRGNPTHLKRNSNINVEIIDSNLFPIPFEISSFKDESQNITVSIQINGNVAPGPINVIIVGVAKSTPDGTLISEELQQTFNVRWWKKINLNIFKRNNSKILFKQSPNSSISNILIPIFQKFYTGSIRTTVYEDGVVKFLSPQQKIYLGPPTSGEGILRPNLKGVKTFTANDSYTSTVGRNAVRSPNPFVIQQGEFISNEYASTLNISGGSFISDMVGGIINIISPTGNLPPVPTGYSITGSQIYSSIVDQVINSGSLRTRDPYVVSIYNVSNSKDVKQHKFNSFEYSNFQITHSITASSIERSNSSQSYLDIFFNNVDLISGDIYRIKSYIKPIDLRSDFLPIGDSIVESQNFLVDTGSYNMIPNRDGDYLYRGIFHQTLSESAYWEISSTKSTDFAGNVGGTPSGSFSKNSSKLIDSIKIQPPTGVLPLSSSHMTVFGNNNLNKILDIKSNHYYTLTFNSYVEPHNSGSSGSWNMDVYVSGSSMYGDKLYGNILGKKIGSLQTDNLQQKRFDRGYFTFKADKEGDLNLYFVVRSGAWYISDVELTSYNEEGFTPNQVKLTLPIENSLANSYHDFKFEYYTFDHKLADYITYINNIKLIKPSLRGITVSIGFDGGGIFPDLEAGGIG